MEPKGGKRRGSSAGSSPSEESSSETDGSIRTAGEADAAAVAALHADQIADGFLSFLGPRFLGRLYRRITRAPGSFLLVADSEVGVVGFIAGSADVGRLYRSFLWHDGPGAAAAVAGRLVRGWRQALETLRHGSGGRVGTGRGFELLAIAVDPAQQSRGLGGRLVASFLAQVELAQGRAAYVVVAAPNTSAIRLYERAGFVPGSEFELHAGTPSLLMQWDKPPPGQEPKGPA
jgi:ribosomal protein S18 acetylase RimI-like enzyme